MHEGNVLSFGAFAVCDNEALEKALKGRELAKVTIWEPVFPEGYNRISLSNIKSPPVYHVKAVVCDKVLDREYNLYDIYTVQHLLHELHMEPEYYTLKDEVFHLIIKAGNLNQALTAFAW